MARVNKPELKNKASMDMAQLNIPWRRKQEIYVVKFNKKVFENVILVPTPKSETYCRKCRKYPCVCVCVCMCVCLCVEEGVEGEEVYWAEGSGVGGGGSEGRVMINWDGLFL